MNRRVIQRRVVVLLLLLGGGAVVNVAVAWGCALWAADNLDSINELPSHVARGLMDEMFPTVDRSKCLRVEAFERSALGRYLKEVNFVYNGDKYQQQQNKQSLSAGIVVGPQGEEYYCGRWEYAGFPFISLSGKVLCDYTSTLKSKRTPLCGFLLPEHGLGSPEDTLYGYVLPVLPLWPGFAINTIFYAAVLWLLFAVPVALRRRRRMRRGLCPACAYDLRGASHQACPECGTKLCEPSTDCVER